MEPKGSFLAPTHYEANGLVLRMYQLGDAAELHRATLASYQHLEPWMPWAKPDLSIAETESNVRRFIASYLSNDDFIVGIWDGETLVGGTGFHMRVGPWEHAATETGMWIVADRAGTGLGSLVLKMMLDWGFSEWPWRRIIWRCSHQNFASARVAEKNGLRKEATFKLGSLRKGVFEDDYLYAILRDEYLGHYSG